VNLHLLFCEQPYVFCNVVLGLAHDLVKTQVFSKVSIVNTKLIFTDKLAGLGCCGITLTPDEQNIELRTQV